jgi:hypothetical protein
LIPENPSETETPGRARSFPRALAVFLIAMVITPMVAIMGLRLYYQHNYSHHLDQAEATILTFHETADQHQDATEAADIGQVTQDPDRAALREGVGSVLDEVKGRECQAEYRRKLTEASVKFLRYKLAQRAMWANGMMNDVESYTRAGKKIDASSEWDGPILGLIVTYIGDGTIRASDLPADLAPFTSIAVNKDVCIK